MKRFLLVILGTATSIDKDLNFIADGEHGVSFVDGKGMFICTFYSQYSVSEIHERLAHRPAIMIFDITNTENYGINLPSKYYMGIFPEIQSTMEGIQEKWESVTTSTKGKVKEETVKEVEEFQTIDEILDKLSRNEYNRDCLTKNELEILNKG